MSLLELLRDPLEDASRSGRIYGVVVGIVTNNQDPEKLGRVKVRFPWLSEQDESHWARIARLMAGAKRGSFFLPEVDDEVLVAFDHGDPRFPYVLGALWNGKDAPPRDNADGQNNLRVIRSRSGHELIFNDEDGKQQVEVVTQGKQQVLLDDSSGSEKITVQDKKGNLVTIDTAKDSITVSSKLKMTLKSQTINIEAGTNMTIKAGGVLTIKGALVKIN